MSSEADEEVETATRFPCPDCPRDYASKKILGWYRRKQHLNQSTSDWWRDGSLDEKLRRGENWRLTNRETSAWISWTNGVLRSDPVGFAKQLRTLCTENGVWDLVRGDSYVAFQVVVEVLTRRGLDGEFR